MTFPYHHGSANYGQRPSESEHLVRDVYLGNIICSCSHVAQVSNMPICTDGGKKKKNNTHLLALKSSLKIDNWQQMYDLLSLSC